MIVRLLAFVLFLGTLMPFALAQDRAPVQLSLDTSQVEQALRILEKQRDQQPVTSADWQALFATVPYQWLKQREAAMHRAFTDEQFQGFLLEPASVARIPEWKRTLEQMKRADLTALGSRMLEWLPPGASIQARVFPSIKPRPNSFVWRGKDGESAIFVYLQEQSTAQFENTVAHECHHIGFSSLRKQQQEVLRGLSGNVKTAVDWLGTFGEGAAMLAAAGSPDTHPHASGDAMSRARWDADMLHFNTDLATLQQFFTDILDGNLQGDEAISKRAAPFWGYQGAWYTVGYEMAALVEKHYGRKAFMECLTDPRKLPAMYNQIALEANSKGASLATWSPEFLARLNAGSAAQAK